VPVALSVAGILLFLGRLAILAQRQRPVTGADALIGLPGRTRTPLAPGAVGQVDVRGEIWRAESAVPLGAGDPVKVMAVNGLTLSVEPAGAATRQGGD
jgi:membrane-bound serine protease (ClpP class)